MKHFRERYRIAPGETFKLSDRDPADTWKLNSKEEAQKRLEAGRDSLCELQGKLYAQNEWSVLLIFQAMDAAGKDSTIKHVMSGVNPQGCQVTSFKQPSTEELNHDFLWRAVRCLPERGRIGIFNRSYYEEVLIVRVHKEVLGSEKLPPKLITRNIWRERFEDINAFEKHLARSGVAIIKFFLHLSRKEQRERFLSRLVEPEKNWKFCTADIQESERWSEYMAAYQDMIRQTSTAHAPWYIVPADHKWFTRLAVASIIESTLKEMKLHYPQVTKEQRQELDRVRKSLEKNKVDRTSKRDYL
jgi:PPK2 family polyphosphate:nucleotide phosphotransferase